MKRTRSQQAFSLLELLITISIIAILTAFLLAGMSRSKAAGVSAACKNNLRQQSLALRLYVDDFGHYFPDMYLHKQNYLTTYVDGSIQGRDAGVFHCPGVKPKKMVVTGPTGDSGVAVYGQTTYAYNDGGTDVLKNELGLAYDWQKGLPELRVKIPSDMIALGDIGAWGTIWHRTRPTTLTESWFFSLPVHDRGANLAFCDSHVEFLKAGRLEERSDRMRRRWNNDNQPHPETWP